MPKKSNILEFIDKANKVHNNKYDYSKGIYISVMKHICIICPLHGEFWQSPANHLSGYSCKTCGYIKNAKEMRNTQEEFLTKAINKHNNEFDYSKSVYIDNKHPIAIICKEHGEFLQRPDAHMNGNKCPFCRLTQNNYSKTNWIKRGENKIGSFYIIRCWNEHEEFYKIGITFNGVKKRYKTKKEMPYNWEIIYETKSKNLKEVWELELKNKRKLKKYSYIPNVIFGGYKTECFNNISYIEYLTETQIEFAKQLLMLKNIE